jgi:hypothetical protein
MIIPPKKTFCDWINGYDEEKIPAEKIIFQPKGHTSRIHLLSARCNRSRSVKYGATITRICMSKSGLH